MRTLYSGALGNFTFDDKSSALNVSILGVFLVIYIFISKVVFVNIMVAIVTNTYETIISRSSKEFAEIVYDLFNQLRYRKRYSGLVILPPPLSSISFFLFPFILKYK